MDEMIQQLSEAVARGDWPQVVGLTVIVLGTLVGAGLKIAGKPVPVLDQVVSLTKAGLKILPKKAPAAPAEGEKQGVEAVVEVKSETPDGSEKESSS